MFACFQNHVTDDKLYLIQPKIAETLLSEKEIFFLRTIITVFLLLYSDLIYFFRPLKSISVNSDFSYKAIICDMDSQACFTLIGAYIITNSNFYKSYKNGFK